VVCTKIFWGPGNGPNDNGLSRKHIIEGTKNSLKRLQLDYVDVLLCHKPDFETPVEETVRAIDYLIQKGMIFYWGTSEWPVERIMEAHRVCEKLGIQKPTIEQPEYNMLNRYKIEKEYLQLFREVGLGTTVWSPMAGGVLSGKYNNGIPEGTKFSNDNPTWKLIHDTYLAGEAREKTMAIFKGLAEIVKELSCTQAQLAYAWVLKNPNVTVCLMGATKISQLEENLQAIELAKKLTPEIMERINKVLNNAPQGSFDFKNWKPFS